MPEKDRLLLGASITLQKCLGLHKHESFLLIHDETTRDFAPIFRKAARNLEIQFHRVFVSKDVQAKGPKAFRTELVRALTAAHGVLVATTDDERCTKFRIILTSEKRNASSAIATMPGASLSILSSAIDVDYDRIIGRCRDLTIPLIRGRNCRIHTYDRQGKEYVLNFELPGRRRPPMQSVGIISRQAWGNVPAGETFVAPIETSANGQYLVNGAVGTEKIRSNQEALLTFEGGQLIAHEYLGSHKPVKHLSRLKQIAEANGHEKCWSTIAEFGIGLNAHIKRFTGVQLVDEKKYGTVHIAIGHNMGYGGATKCGSVHCDITTADPTVWIDEALIIDRGKHIDDFGAFKDNYRSAADDADAWKAESEFVRLNDDSYELDNSGILWVKRRTSSGRETVYALGDEDSSRLACQLVSLFEGHQSASVAMIRSSLGLNQRNTIGLLTLLHRAGVISP